MVQDQQKQQHTCKDQRGQSVHLRLDPLADLCVDLRGEGIESGPFYKVGNYEIIQRECEGLLKARKREAPRSRAAS